MIGDNLMDNLRQDLKIINDSINELENQIQNAKTEAEHNIKPLKIELAQVKSDKSNYARKNDFDSVQNCRIKENNLKFKIDAQWNKYILLTEDLFKLNTEKINLEKQINFQEKERIRIEKEEKEKIKRINEMLSQMEEVLNNYKNTQSLKQAAIDSNINPYTVEHWFNCGKHDYNEIYSNFYKQIIEIDNFFKDLAAQKLKKQMDDVIEAYIKTNSLKEASKIANVSYNTVQYWYDWGSKGFGKENTYFFKKLIIFNKFYIYLITNY